MRRSIAALGVLVALAASAPVAFPGRAGADGANCVPSPPPVSEQASLVVTWSGSVSGSRTFSACELNTEPTQDAAVYFTCQTVGCPGGVGTFQAPPGLDLRSLIGLLGAGFTPESVQSMTISAPSGPDVQVPGAYLAANTDGAYPFCPVDPEHKLYPILYEENASQIAYLRPQLASSGQCPSTDPNIAAGQQVEADNSSQMTIEISVAGIVLLPTISATVTSLPVGGGDTTFSARVPGGATDHATYQWTFGDGSTQTTTQDTVVHHYTQSSQAFVVVHDGIAAGQSKSITVRVKSRPAPTPSQTHSTPAQGTSRSNPAIGPTSGGGIHVGGGPTAASEGPTASARPSGAAVQTASAAMPSKTPASTTSSAPGSSSAIPSAPSELAVEGVLLAGGAGGHASPAQQPTGQVGAAPAERAATKAPSPAITFGLCLSVAVVALLVVGAYSEARRPGRGPKRRA